MDVLWAPWRSNYIRVGTKKKKCIFCHAPRSSRDAANFIVKRNRSAYAILNIYPYNTGHVMVAPLRHKRDFGPLTDAERLDIISLVDEMQKALKRTLKPHSFNIGINMGSVAGAGYGKHLHIHIVPRWRGDTNFMPILGGTKVISQSLRALYQKLKKAL